MKSAASRCILFYRKSSVFFFSPKLLKFRMCTAIKYCSDFVNSVSIALQSSATAHRILSSLPFIQRRRSEVQNCFIVLWYFCHFRSCALMVFCYLTKVEIISFERRKLLRYVP